MKKTSMSFDEVVARLAREIGAPDEVDHRDRYWIRDFKAPSGGSYTAPAVHVGTRASGEAYVIFDRDRKALFAHTIVTHSPECPDVESALSRDGSCTLDVVIEAAKRVLA